MKKKETNDLPPCLIFIDKEGRWYHRGMEMIHREFISFFYENMELDSQGRYVISWNDQRCYVDVEDTAFVVRSVVFRGGNQNQDASFTLHLSDDTEEELLADTLFVGKENVLYCNVKNRTFPARFSRAAYYQLAAYIQEENGTYFLSLSGKKYYIVIDSLGSS